MDPVLALLDFLDGYRRSWRCWRIGGPAAVDELVVGPAAVTAGARLLADFEYEVEDHVERQVLASQARDDHWYDHPRPCPPERGQFRDEVQSFPLADTRAFEWCLACRGRGRKRCRACKGTGGRACEFCGGTGCPDCAERRGHQECPTCAGKGWIRCTCADAQTFTPLIHYEAARFTYTHYHEARDVLPAEDLPGAARKLLRKALADEGRFAEVEAETAKTLADRAADLLPTPVRSDLVQAAGHVERQAALPVRGRLLFQRLRARAAPLASVRLSLGRASGGFWAAGAGEDPRGTANGIETEVVEGLGYWAKAAFYGAIAASLSASDASFPVEAAMSTLAAIELGLALQSRRHLGVLSRWRRSLRRPQPLPSVAITGPDAARSGILFSLLAHLAATAQLADPARGGTLLDDTHAALFGMLDGDAGRPEWSATYRMQNADCRMQNGGGAATDEGDAEGRAVRVVHVVPPPGGELGPLHRRALGRAAQAWLVLPAGIAPAEAEGWVEAVATAAPGARVTLVAEGEAPAVPSGMRVWRTDLRRLRDRYLSGALSPTEAAGIVAWLSGGLDVPPPEEPTVEAPALSQKIPAPPRQERAR